MKKRLSGINRIMSRIRAVHPDGTVTDCLICRIRFQQLADYPVFHPAEVLHQAYEKHLA